MGGSVVRRAEEDISDAIDEGVGLQGMNEQTTLLAVSEPKFSKAKVLFSYRTRAYCFLAIVVSAATFLLRRRCKGGCSIVGLLASDASIGGNSFSKPNPSFETTETSTITQYGEVWLIRHGEKDPVPPVSSSSSHHSQRLRIKKMYELNMRGWDRAEHLGSLVRSKKWPPFHALFATRPATPREVEAAYPDAARDETGQSLIWREYQTLLPISRYLQRPIRAEFAKGEIEQAALEVASTAIDAAAIAIATTKTTAQGEGDKVPPGSSEGSNGTQSHVVLVSWDHCSLPTLVVRGFGCKSNECYRCWSDYRFGDVLKLNVSVTTTFTVATDSDVSSTTPAWEEVSLSSTILSMTCEHYPGDRYCFDGDGDGESSEDPNVSRDDWTEASAPCVPSYCTERSSTDYLVDCLCYDSSSPPRWVYRRTKIRDSLPFQVRGKRAFP